MYRLTISWGTRVKGGWEVSQCVKPCRSWDWCSPKPVSCTWEGFMAAWRGDCLFLPFSQHQQVCLSSCWNDLQRLHTYLVPNYFASCVKAFYGQQAVKTWALFLVIICYKDSVAKFCKASSNHSVLISQGFQSILNLSHCQPLLRLAQSMMQSTSFQVEGIQILSLDNYWTFVTFLCRFVCGRLLGERGGAGYLAAVSPEGVVYGSGESLVILTRVGFSLLTELYRSYWPLSLLLDFRIWC